MHLPAIPDFNRVQGGQRAQRLTRPQRQARPAQQACEGQQIGRDMPTRAGRRGQQGLAAGDDAGRVAIRRHPARASAISRAASSPFSLAMSS